MKNLPVTGWSNEVEQDVDTIVSEARVTFDARLFSENIVVLSLEEPDNLGETIMLG